MRTPRLLTAATAVVLTITALTGCSAALYEAADHDSSTAHPAPTATAEADGRFKTPLESQAGGGSYIRANWVRLPDGRKVLCVGTTSIGFDCNWDDIRSGASK